MTPADYLLSLLDEVRSSGTRRWVARCPAHENKSRNLSVREADDGRVLLRCFAGCTTGDVVAAVGLGMRDLFSQPEMAYPPAPTESQRLEREFRREHPKADPVFFDSWLKYRAAGGREIGTPVSRYAFEFVATVPNLSEFPGELTAYRLLGLDAPLERDRFSQSNLEMLAVWVAEALRPAFALEVSVAEASRPSPPVFDPLAKFFKKLSRVTRGRR